MSAVRRCCGALVTALLVVACAAPQSPEGRARAAWVSAVTSLRADADRSVSEQDLPAAEATLQRALALKVPPGAAAAQLLTQDLYFALASVRFARGAAPEALQSCEQGLAAGPAHSVFAANLLAVRGMVLEATGQALPAAEAYAQAMAIHKALYDAALEAP